MLHLKDKKHFIGSKYFRNHLPKKSMFKSSLPPSEPTKEQRYGWKRDPLLSSQLLLCSSPSAPCSDLAGLPRSGPLWPCTRGSATPTCSLSFWFSPLKPVLHSWVKNRLLRAYLGLFLYHLPWLPIMCWIRHKLLPQTLRPFHFPFRISLHDFCSVIQTDAKNI